MTLAVLAALPEEIFLVKESLSDRNTERFGEVAATRGTFAGCDVVTAAVGVGPKRSTACTKILLERIKPACAIVCGFAGGLTAKASPGCMVVATDLVLEAPVRRPRLRLMRKMQPFFPRRVGPLSEPVAVEPSLVQAALRAAGQRPVVAGRMVSTWVGVFNPVVRRRLLEATGAVAVDMESAAMAQTAKRLGVRLVVLKAISDSASLLGLGQFLKNRKAVTEANQRAVLSMIDLI